MKLETIQPGQLVIFRYTNWRGQCEMRSVMFISLQYGSNEWYPEPQMFLYGKCEDREAYRSFAIKQIDMSDLVFSW